MSPQVGLVKTSLIDYPGEIAATVFTAGCNLRCPYCHNPQLVEHEIPADFVPLAEVVSLLKARSGRVGAVCITGGEPLLQPWLPRFVAQVREMGFKVKLDTNGMSPGRLNSLRLDYLAVDLKLAPGRYGVLGGPADTEPKLRATIAWARTNVPTVEYRTTVVPGLVHQQDIESIVRLLQPADRLTLAAFRPGHTLDPAYQSISAPEAEIMEYYRRLALEAGLDCQVRGQRAIKSVEAKK